MKRRQRKLCEILRLLGQKVFLSIQICLKLRIVKICLIKHMKLMEELTVSLIMPVLHQ